VQKEITAGWEQWGEKIRRLTEPSNSLIQKLIKSKPDGFAINDNLPLGLQRRMTGEGPHSRRGVDSRRYLRYMNRRVLTRGRRP